MKSVQIRSFSGPNAGKYGPEKTPYLHTFHAVIGAMIVYDLRDYRLKKSQFWTLLLKSIRAIFVIEKVLES